jgi:hypothetical protein
MEAGVSDLGWWDRAWYDKKQNERLDSLSDEHRHQRAELRAQVTHLQGDLQALVNALASAFDAFVELCDVGEELRAFQPVAEARNRARRGRQPADRHRALGRGAGRPPGG